MDSRQRLLGMPSAARLLLLPTLFSIANGLPWPAPTLRPLHETAPWDSSSASPSGSRGQYLKRDDGQSTICGWREGDFSRPASCATGSRCIYDTLHMVVGCCPETGLCTAGIYTSCVDKNMGSKTDSGPNVLHCSGASVCYQDSYPGGYHRYGCGAYADAASIATTYAGQLSPSSLQVVYTALSLATGVVTSVTPTATASATPIPLSSSSMGPTVPKVTVVATSTAPAVTATASVVAAPESTDRNPSGMIVGGVVGGLSFSLGILAAGCFFLRRRQRRSRQEIGAVRVMKDLTSRNASVAVIKHTNSISSFASSDLSELTHVHPFSPDDVGGSVISFPQSEKLLRVPTPPLQSHPAMQGEMHGLVSPMSPTSFVDVPLDDLAGLPLPWTRPPTPPPRSPKRLQRQSAQSQQSSRLGQGQTMQESAVERMAPVEEADFPQPESLAPLEIYLTSPVTAVPRTRSIVSSVSENSHYSRTTDGQSITEGSRSRDSWKTHAMPPLPIIRKPVGGWYRTPSTILKKDMHMHIGYHMVDGATLERDIITALPPTRQRSASGPIPLSDVQVGNMNGLTRYISEGWRRDHGDLTVAPLALTSPREREVPKPGSSSPVPILSVPAAPSAGEREKRLYDI